MHSWLLGLAFACAPVGIAAPVSDLSPDEQIVFYPTIGARLGGSLIWELEIHGCVFETESRRFTLAAFREALELKGTELTPAESAVFNQRARLFLVDNERSHRVVVQVGTRECNLGKSAPNGHFHGKVRVSEAELGLASKPGDGEFVTIRAKLKAKDKRSFVGQVCLLDDTGVSVISDIDDTIKITEVRDRRATLRNTFLREFQPVPGMAEFYQMLAQSNAAAFHYVSASPWPLFTPLAEFAQTNGFPAGTFHLKTFRWKDRSFFSLFSDPERYKLSVIEPLLKRFPQRRFILVGDSGERDPEIYAKLAPRFPAQIVGIYIRAVTGETAESPRYREAFKGIAPDLWRVFREPGEMEKAISP